MRSAGCCGDLYPGDISELHHTPAEVRDGDIISIRSLVLTVEYLMEKGRKSDRAPRSFGSSRPFSISSSPAFLHQSACSLPSDYPICAVPSQRSLPADPEPLAPVFIQTPAELISGFRLASPAHLSILLKAEL